MQPPASDTLKAHLTSQRALSHEAVTGCSALTALHLELADRLMICLLDSLIDQETKKANKIIVEI